MSKSRTNGGKRGRDDSPGESATPRSKEPRRLVSAAPTPFRLWSVDDVSAFLSEKEIPEEAVQAFKDEEIEGKHLPSLNKQDLSNMGISALGTQLNIMEVLRSLQRSLEEVKVFNDPIHGHIEMHPLMVKIIDTPQFQRLRYIKQLGGAYYVFPGASHNRFEHSIGVGYLAGELVETLQRKQPELDITDQDVLCVKIAGLCHDLGHGPFSHMFDRKFIPKVRSGGKKWKHEDASVMMFNYLLKENKLMPEFEKYGLGDQDIEFIKEQIQGPVESEMCSQIKPNWPYCGRTKDKSFLYEVVANKRNGIDVDKWDYFARDCYFLGIPNNFDRGRYMKFARVIDVNDRRQICTRDKEVRNLYEMFHTRSLLHQRAYKHKTANIVELMITEALVKANEHFLLSGRDGQPVKMSEAIEDPYVYTRLTDHVIHQILVSPDPTLEEARLLLEQVERRELYKYIGKPSPSVNIDKDRCIAGEIISVLAEDDLEGLPTLTADDLLVDVVTFDYGMKEGNPINRARFYQKDSPDVAIKVTKEQVSRMLPEKFKEQQIRVYCKRLDKPSIQAALKYFQTWCDQQECDTPRGEGVATDSEMDTEEGGFTPYGAPYGTPKKDGGDDDKSCTPLKSTQKKMRRNLQFQ